MYSWLNQLTFLGSVCLIKLEIELKHFQSYGVVHSYLTTSFVSDSRVE